MSQFVEPPFSDGEVNTVLNWARALRRIGVDVTILSLSSKYCGYKQLFNLSFEYVKTDHPRFQSDICDALLIQKELLRQSDFDVIHFASSMDGLLALPMLTLKKLQKRKLINSYHTNSSYRYTRLFRRFMFDIITVPSKRMLESFIKMQTPCEKLRLISPCIDEHCFCPRDKSKIREELGLPEDAFIIFTIGHFRHGRMLAQLIQIVNDFVVQGKNIQLLIGWTGHGEKQCIDEIFSVARRSNFIKIIPPTDKINLYYNASDIYVLSARSGYVIENPLSLMEASSSGIPTLAFNINASPELIKDGVTGYVIEDNNFAQLKLKLSHLMDNENVLSALSGNARKLALSSYSYEKVGLQLFHLYTELVDLN